MSPGLVVPYWSCLLSRTGLSVSGDQTWQRCLRDAWKRRICPSPTTNCLVSGSNCPLLALYYLFIFINTIIEEAFGFAAAIRQSFEVRAIQRVGLLRVVVIVCGGGVVVLGLDGLGEV